LELGNSGFSIAELHASPSEVANSFGKKYCKPVLPADVDAEFCHSPYRLRIVAQRFEHGLKVIMQSQDWSVRGLNCAPARILDNLARLLDLAKKLVCDSKV
jgi:hypothetical protein